MLASDWSMQSRDVTLLASDWSIQSGDVTMLASHWLASCMTDWGADWESVDCLEAWVC